MPKTLLAFVFFFIYYHTQAGIIRGKVTNEKQEALPFASVFIKGTTNGTTTNSAGQFHLDVPAGTYILVCQYMGYKKEEKQVTVTDAGQEINFVLAPLSLQIKEVVVKSGGEDPAYAIIRQAIKKRAFYLDQVKEYTCNDYIKGIFKMRDMPNSFLGQKINKDDLDDMGLDSNKRGVLFLSESVTKVAVKRPDDVKIEVLSARQSGGGFGFSFPAFIDFYENNVTAMVSQFNKRGFISPIAENALFYYKYRLEGVFQDDGKTVNKIKVIPRRKYEPLFSGYIFITNDDWRIHSVDMMVTQEYQLEIMDTLHITQIHVPVNADVWRTKDQVINVSIKQFGFNVVGSFVNVYSNYNLTPNFPKRYFDRTIMRYDTAFDRKQLAYWDSVRPVPLEPEEVSDFHKKDSIARNRRDSAQSAWRLDTLRSRQKPVNPLKLLYSTGGVEHKYYFKRDTGIYYHLLEMKSLLTQVEYNTVEGISINLEPTLTFDLPAKQELRIIPRIRYGFSNTHLNAYTYLSWAKDAKLAGRYGSNTWTIGGGKRISQFNRDNPISPVANIFYTLLFKDNYMKLYENWFGELRFRRRFESSATIMAGLSYEDRIPVENTTDYSFRKDSSKHFLPNHPYELAGIPFNRNQALVLNLSFSFQPGQRFIELPDRKVAIGSKYPVFRVGYSKGIPDIAGSDANFDKWNFEVRDNVNLKLFGEFQYRFGVGGFLNSQHVDIPDFQHFNGNQTFYNIKYLNSFQLAPYYRYSNTSSLYGTANVEHHFNGLLTNKIPLFNRLKWNLVAGSNAFYVNRDNNYVEVFAGLENILKVIRVDVIAGYQSKDDTRIGVRVGFGGLFGGLVRPQQDETVQ
ncbi:DUF5686 and carboxypeptidase regulatory-like domain-containing protein [Chitinophaga filiformis]|uniref:DUF5686 and carboxypeptidase regulatory-like domain-containing protein n=1 Tax=Chitinophaga filiformis TaxID=104663 RepID=A0ABY4HTH0_CHIFI|nr:DUF5686 and carboxypeptidase regulatory-like domain-containing protein [Chitinophaga filiformis]UPK67071.1 DUF5686 and carboxypeptidase regulatory-like domain-containing protein [Chitinophaga filiformis]